MAYSSPEAVNTIVKQLKDHQFVAGSIDVFREPISPGGQVYITAIEKATKNKISFPIDAINNFTWGPRAIVGRNYALQREGEWIHPTLRVLANQNQRTFSAQPVPVAGSIALALRVGFDRVNSGRSDDPNEGFMATLKGLNKDIMPSGSARPSMGMSDNAQEAFGGRIRLEVVGATRGSYDPDEHLPPAVVTSAQMWLGEQISSRKGPVVSELPSYTYDALRLKGHYPTGEGKYLSPVAERLVSATDVAGQDRVGGVTYLLHGGLKPLADQGKLSQPRMPMVEAFPTHTVTRNGIPIKESLQPLENLPGTNPLYAFSTVTEAQNAPAPSLRENVIFGPSPFSGGGARFTPPQSYLDQVEGFGRPSNPTGAPFPVLKPSDLIGGENAAFRFTPANIAGRDIPADQGTFNVGSFTMGGQEQSVEFGKGSHVFHPNENAGVMIPGWMDVKKNIWKEGPGAPGDTNIVSTESFAKQYAQQSRLTVERGGSSVVPFVRGYADYPARVRGLEMKDLGVATAQPFQWHGKDIIRYTGERKGINATGVAFFGSRNWDQQRGFVRDWAQNEGSTEASIFNEWFGQKFQPAKGQASNVLYEEMADKWRELNPKYQGAGSEMLADIFHSVIETPDLKTEAGRNKNEYNIMHYDAGQTGPIQVDWGAITKSNLAIVQEQQITSLMQMKQGMTREEAQSQVSKVLQLKQVGGQLPHLVQNVENAIYANVLSPRIANMNPSWEGKGVGLLIRQALTTQDRAFAQGLGIASFQNESTSPMTRAIQGIGSFLSFQQTLQEGRMTPEGMPTGGVNEISGQRGENVLAKLHELNTLRDQMTEQDYINRASEALGDEPGKLIHIKAGSIDAMMPSISDVSSFAKDIYGEDTTAVNKKIIRALRQVTELGRSAPGNNAIPATQLGAGAVSSLYDYFTEVSTGEGEFGKKLWSAQANALSAQYSSVLALPANAAFLNESKRRELDFNLRRAGMKDETALTKLLGEQGIDIALFRHPTARLNEGGLFGKAFSGDWLAKTMGQQSLKNLMTDPNTKNDFFVGLGINVQGFGDLDGDYLQMIAGITVDKNGELKPINAVLSHIAADPMRIARQIMKAGLTPFTSKEQGIRTMGISPLFQTNKLTGELEPYDVASAAESKPTIASAQDVQTRTMEGIQSKIKMGIVYNAKLRRELGAYGFTLDKEADVAGSADTTMAPYATALDGYKLGFKNAGTAFVNMMNSAYVANDERNEDKPTLSVGTGMYEPFYPSRDKTYDESGNETAVPYNRSAKLPIEDMYTNKFRDFVAKVGTYLTQPVTEAGKDTKFYTNSPEDIVNAIALPKHRSKLLSELKAESDPDKWGDITRNYITNKLVPGYLWNNNTPTGVARRERYIQGLWSNVGALANIAGTAQYRTEEGTIDSSPYAQRLFNIAIGEEATQKSRAIAVVQRYLLHKGMPASDEAALAEATAIDRGNRNVVTETLSMMNAALGISPASREALDKMAAMGQTPILPPMPAPSKEPQTPADITAGASIPADPNPQKKQRDMTAVERLSQIPENETQEQKMHRMKDEALRAATVKVNAAKPPTVGGMTPFNKTAPDIRQAMTEEERQDARMRLAMGTTGQDLSSNVKDPIYGTVDKSPLGRSGIGTSSNMPGGDGSTPESRAVANARLLALPPSGPPPPNRPPLEATPFDDDKYVRGFRGNATEAQINDPATRDKVTLWKVLKSQWAMARSGGGQQAAQGQGPLNWQDKGSGINITFGDNDPETRIGKAQGAIIAYNQFKQDIGGFEEMLGTKLDEMGIAPSKNLWERVEKASQMPGWSDIVSGPIGEAGKVIGKEVVRMHKGLFHLREYSETHGMSDEQVATYEGIRSIVRGPKSGELQWLGNIDPKSASFIKEKQQAREQRRVMGIASKQDAARKHQEKLDTAAFNAPQLKAAGMAGGINFTAGAPGLVGELAAAMHNFGVPGTVSSASFNQLAEVAVPTPGFLASLSPDLQSAVKQSYKQFSAASKYATSIAEEQPQVTQAIRANLTAGDQAGLAQIGSAVSEMGGSTRSSSIRPPRVPMTFEERLANKATNEIRKTGMQEQSMQADAIQLAISNPKLARGLNEFADAINRVATETAKAIPDEKKLSEARKDASHASKVISQETGHGANLAELYSKRQLLTQARDTLTSGGIPTPEGLEALGGMSGEEGLGLGKGSNLGRLGREIFGGWGLMYMRSVGGIMEQGMGGAGFSERSAYQQAMRQSAIQGGSFDAGTNMANYYQNRMALTGATYSPQQAIAMIGAQNPALRQAGSTIMSGFGGLAASMWGSSMLEGAGMGVAKLGVGAGGRAAGWLSAMAPALAVGIAGGSFFAGAAAGSYDTQGLALQASRAMQQQGGNYNLAAALSNPQMAASIGWNYFIAPDRLAATVTQAQNYNQISEYMTGQAPTNIPAGTLLQRVAQRLFSNIPTGKTTAATPAQGLNGIEQALPGTTRAERASVVSQGIITKSPFVSQTGAVSAGNYLAFNSGLSALGGPTALEGEPLTQADKLQAKLASAYGAGVDIPGLMTGMAMAFGMSPADVLGRNGVAAKDTEAYLMQNEGMAQQEQQMYQMGAQVIGQQSGAAWQKKTTLTERLRQSAAAATFANNPEKLALFSAQNDLIGMGASMFGINAPNVTATQFKAQTAGMDRQQIAVQQAGIQTVGNFMSNLYQGNPMAWGYAAQQAGTTLQGYSGQTTFGTNVSMQWAGRTGVDFATGAVNGTPYGATSWAGGTFGSEAGAWSLYGNTPLGNLAKFGPDANLTNMQAGQMSVGNIKPISALTKDFYTKAYGSIVGGAIWQNSLEAKAGGGTKLANGQIVGGDIGFAQDIANQQYGLQMAGIGIAAQGIALNEAFTTGVGIGKYNPTNPQTGQKFGFNTGKFSVNVEGAGSFTSQGGGMWGLADAQRNLGYMQQEWGFGAQQRQINLQSKQFGESMGMQWKGMQLSREQGTYEYQYATGMAQQQFGFSQTMFREQARFTSGRERRIAEMENRQNVTVYNAETANRDKEFGFQKQSWKLQEDQYHLQIRQFSETKKLQQEQLNMSINFYREGKKLTEESILLQRAQWVEEIKNQKASLGVQAAQITLSYSLANADRARQANEVTLKGSLDNLNAQTFPKLIQNLTTNIPNAFTTMINKLRATVGLGAIGDTGAGTGGGCFIAGTEITMADGSDKPIELIEVGDKVMSYDIEAKTPVTAEVIEVFLHNEHTEGGFLLINSVFGVTMEHEMYINGEWARAKTLSIGDKLMNHEGRYATVTSLRWIEGGVPVYNFHTNHETHNYFAKGVLVHNMAAAVKTATGGIISAGEWAIAGDISGARSGYEELVHALPGGGAAIYSNTQSKLKLDAIMGNKMVKSGGGGTKAERQPINIYVGTEKLASMVIDIVKNDLAN